MKPSKSIIKPDDPTKTGRKRAPSDQHDELIAQRRNTLKRQELVPAPKKRSLTDLNLKFPDGSSLPSIAELKAKLARFGQIEVSRIRVYWKSLTCTVCYVYKADAEAACHYCRNNDIFGHVKVMYHLSENDL